MTEVERIANLENIIESLKKENGEQERLIKRIQENIDINNIYIEQRRKAIKGESK